MKAVLILEDGTVARGEGIGAATTAFGELVFNTGMTGYQEAMTDPSYSSQILMFTYPMIGNYGINDDDFESDGPKIAAIAVREHCAFPSHRKNKRTVSEFLKKSGIPGIEGIDTRAITIRIRTQGTMKACVAVGDDIDEAALLKQLTEMPHPCDSNLVATVSCKKITTHEGEGDKTLVLIDCGQKENILRNLKRFATVIQVPYDTTAETIRGLNGGAIDGIFVSNGPGDPSHPELLATTVETLRALKDEYPIMGICLGNQLLALAFGATTFKLKFGHRGANQPVFNRETGTVYITSQNHGYAVDVKSAEAGDFVVTQVNNNDATVEGMRHRTLPIFSVQYHPEASPGPHDTNWLFDAFIDLIDKQAQERS